MSLRSLRGIHRRARVGAQGARGYVSRAEGEGQGCYVIPYVSETSYLANDVMWDGRSQPRPRWPRRQQRRRRRQRKKERRRETH
eukprot:2636449-Heterocapsa_arctica.AAC.1